MFDVGEEAGDYYIAMEYVEGKTLQDILVQIKKLNAEAFAATQSTGFIHFWSRSRGKLWRKGETSGETFRVVEIKVDCDQDCLLVKVEALGKGKACHTGRRSCFYRAIAGESLIFKD